jgi:antitoxin YefM
MTTVTLSEAKAKLARLLGEVTELGEHVLITRSGKPAGVLMSVEDYEGLLETLEILADSQLAEEIKRGLEQIEAGDTVSHDELWNELDRQL